MRRGLVLAICAALVVGAGWWWYSSPSLGISGLEDGMRISSQQLTEAPFEIEASGVAGEIRLSVDGKQRALTEIGDSLVWKAPALPEGRHELTITAARRMAGSTSTTVEFVVDDTPPKVRLTDTGPAPIADKYTLSGRTEPQSSLRLGGMATTAGANGAFSVDFEHPPIGTLVVTDPAGNVTRQRLVTPVRYPGATSVHVTSSAWADPVIKGQVMSLIKKGNIDTVELDLKDERGVVGYDSTVPLAEEIGAVKADYVLDDAVAELHELGVRVVGRIVAFRDPMLAEAAWAKGDSDWVIQTPDGQRFPAYGGGFVNYANAGVRRYNLDIAVEASKSGIDEIMWDYMRRPEGSPDDMVVPGRGEKPSSDFIVAFLAAGHPQLRAAGVMQTVAVFGIAVDRGDSIAQDVPAMARHVDAISPMLYPSHWNAGEYGIANPDRQPYDIVHEAMTLFAIAVRGSDTPVAPWIQDFDSTMPYGPEEVALQIAAAKKAGAEGVHIWNPDVQYSLGEITPKTGENP